VAVSPLGDSEAPLSAALRQKVVFSLQRSAEVVALHNLQV